MANTTSTYDLEQKVKAAKSALAKAKKDKMDAATIAALTKNLKIAESTLKQVKAKLKN